MHKFYYVQPSPRNPVVLEHIRTIGAGTPRFIKFYYRRGNWGTIELPLAIAPNSDATLGDLVEFTGATFGRSRDTVCKMHAPDHIDYVVSEPSHCCCCGTIMHNDNAMLLRAVPEEVTTVFVEYEHGWTNPTSCRGACLLFCWNVACRLVLIAIWVAIIYGILAGVTFD